MTSLMNTYPPPPVTFVRGEGTRAVGRRRQALPRLPVGLAVTSLGHAHPAVADAVAEQARTLLHVSNLYGTDGRARGRRHPRPPARRRRPGLLLQLRRRGQRVRHQAGPQVGRARPPRVVVSAYGSFHGRTLATLHATGQPQKHEAFQPLPEGFRHVAWDDLDALEAALDPTVVAAVLLEPVQGEGGVNPATAEYFQGVRRLCDERGVLLMVDEVQTGLGRTGQWFGFQHFGVEPDVVTMAKALGNGVPIGACWAGPTWPPPSSPATTPRPSAASRSPPRRRGGARGDGGRGLPARAERAGQRLADALAALPGVVAVRGLGLLLAAELEERTTPRRSPPLRWTPASSSTR